MKRIAILMGLILVPSLIMGESVTRRILPLSSDALLLGGNPPEYYASTTSVGGFGDMFKSTYDIADSGVVDNSEKLDGQIPSYYAVASDVATSTNSLSGDISANRSQLLSVATDTTTIQSNLDAEILSTNSRFNAVSTDTTTINSTLSNHTGDATIHFTEASINISTNQVTSFEDSVIDVVKANSTRGFAISFAESSFPYISHSAPASPTWDIVAYIIFEGTNTFGVPTSMEILQGGSLANDRTWRIYDETNALPIVTTGSLNNTTIAISDMGTISNVGAETAVWEIQVQRTGSPHTARLASIFIRRE